MGRYFINVNTLEQLRRQYKELLKRFHPDNGGSEEIMKAVNVEYDKLFKVLKDRHESKSADGQEETDKAKSAYNANMYDWENDKALREVLQKIINFSGICHRIDFHGLFLLGSDYKLYK